MLQHLSIHIWRYIPFWALASPIRRLHSSLFSALLLHPLIPSSSNTSLWTTSNHLVLGLPTGLVVWKFQFKTFFFWNSFFFHSYYVTCPSQSSDFNVLHDVWLIVQTVQFIVPSGTPASPFLCWAIYSSQYFPSKRQQHLYSTYITVRFANHSLNLNHMV